LGELFAGKIVDLHGAKVVLVALGDNPPIAPPALID
jgi:hypothetical protein